MFGKLSMKIGQVESLYKNGAKTAEWSEGVLHAGISGHPFSVFKLNQTCFIESLVVMRWIFEYNPETVLKQSVEPKANKTVKVMLNMFFGVSGIIHWEFLPQGQISNQQVNKEILQHMKVVARQIVAASLQ